MTVIQRMNRTDAMPLMSQQNMTFIVHRPLRALAKERQG